MTKAAAALLLCADVARLCQGEGEMNAKWLATGVIAVLALSVTAMVLAAETPKKAPTWFHKAQAEGAKATCIVTGAEITVQQGTVFSVYEDRYFYFANAEAKAKFDADPALYVTE